MPHCIKCKAEISEDQFQNLDKKCTECINKELGWILDQDWRHIKKGGFG